MEELTATDMAVARYRTRHEWMNEVFGPISLGMVLCKSPDVLMSDELGFTADMPPPPNPYEYLHAKALEDQIVSLPSCTPIFQGFCLMPCFLNQVQLERQALDIEKHGLARLEETKASFAAIEREVYEQQASVSSNP
jgi:hypothetical protein